MWKLCFVAVCFLASSQGLELGAFGRYPALFGGKRVSLSMKPLRNDLRWTDEKDMSKYLPDASKNDDKGRSTAYRDLFAENVIRKIVNRIIDGIRNPGFGGFGGGFLRDPFSLRNGIHLTKKEEMFSIDMTTKQMKVRGLSNLQLDYIRVVRHFGLQDAKISLRIKTDLNITGRYELDGTAIGFLPVTGEGDFEIFGKDVGFSAISYAVSRKMDGKDDVDLTIKEMDGQITYGNVVFKFSNLMGGGVVGSTANVVVNAMGEAIVESQKLQVISLVRNKYKEILNRLL